MEGILVYLRAHGFRGVRGERRAFRLLMRGPAGRPASLPAHAARGDEAGREGRGLREARGGGR
eukprot:1047083-Lingulodinium_polyedra.AAC.1